MPVLDRTPCGDGVECATAAVPLDYDDPPGERIELSLVRRPATDVAHRIDSLFVNDGGPGNSPVAFVEGDALDVLSDDVLPDDVLPDDLLADNGQARCDVIGFDRRGVGASTPIRCFASSARRHPVWMTVSRLICVRATTDRRSRTSRIAMPTTTPSLNCESDATSIDAPLLVAAARGEDAAMDAVWAAYAGPI